MSRHTIVIAVSVDFPDDVDIKYDAAVEFAAHAVATLSESEIREGIVDITPEI